MTIILKGMTWDHPRGYGPLEACSALWKERTGIELSWDRRSLQDFESYPVEKLARQYDLIVIDHPHIGQLTREDCLLPFEGYDLEEISRGTVGKSFPSYEWQGRQWALPIDAAAQILAWRPDRLINAPTGWDEVLELARDGRVALPMRAPHSLMCLYTLCAQLGSPGCVEGPDLFDLSVGAEVCARLRALTRHIDPVCYMQDPIAMLEQMARPEATIDCVPLIYGYVNYACAGFRPVRIGFADIPTIDGRPPAGSALGGTGMAISAFSAYQAEAVAFALWVAGPEAQRGPFAAAGGQPGHTTAWDDDAVNATTHNFYSATRLTLEGAWVRPRHDGYMRFQHAASERLVQGLQSGEPGRALIADINRMFRESLSA